MHIAYIPTAYMPMTGVTGKMRLYEGGIEPNDICQGAVGNCWLISAFAAAAEQPSVIRNTFITLERNPRGKYKVRLFYGQ